MGHLLIDFEKIEQQNSFLLKQKNANKKKQERAYSVSQCCFFKGRSNIIQKVIFNFDDNFCV